MHRGDLSAVFEAYEDLQMIKMDHIKLPKLTWSCRSLNLLPKQVACNAEITTQEKLIVAGLCNYKGSDRPFIARLAVTFSIPNVTTPRRDESKQK